MYNCRGNIYVRGVKRLLYLFKLRLVFLFFLIAVSPLLNLEKNIPLLVDWPTY